jgi:hypothetical protein
MIMAEFVAFDNIQQLTRMAGSLALLLQGKAASELPPVAPTSATCGSSRRQHC